MHDVKPLAFFQDPSVRHDGTWPPRNRHGMRTGHAYRNFQTTNPCTPRFFPSGAAGSTPRGPNSSEAVLPLISAAGFVSLAVHRFPVAVAAQRIFYGLVLPPLTFKVSPST